MVRHGAPGRAIQAQASRDLWLPLLLIMACAAHMASAAATTMHHDAATRTLLVKTGDVVTAREPNPAGNYRGNTCPRGYYKPPGTPECLPCPVGTYWKNGADSAGGCEHCPRGTTTTSPGAVKKQDCSGGSPAWCMAHQQTYCLPLSMVLTPWGTTVCSVADRVGACSNQYLDACWSSSAIIFLHRPCTGMQGMHKTQVGNTEPCSMQCVQRGTSHSATSARPASR